MKLENYYKQLTKAGRISFKFILLNLFTPNRILGLRNFSIKDSNLYIKYGITLPYKQRQNIKYFNDSFGLKSENKYRGVNYEGSRALTMFFRKTPFDLNRVNVGKRGDSSYMVLDQNIYFKLDGVPFMVVELITFIILHICGISNKLENIYGILTFDIVIMGIVCIFLNIFKVLFFYFKQRKVLQHRFNEYQRAFEYFILGDNMEYIRLFQDHIFNEKIQLFLDDEMHFMMYGIRDDNGDKLINHHDPLTMNKFELDVNKVNLSNIFEKINILEYMVDSSKVNTFTYLNTYIGNTIENKNVLSSEEFVINADLNINNINIVFDFNLVKGEDVTGVYYFSLNINNLDVKSSFDIEESLFKDFLLENNLNLKNTLSSDDSKNLGKYFENFI